MEKMSIKKRVCDFGNDLMKVPNGEFLILNSFASMYLFLKNNNTNCEEYKVLKNFFENKLELLPSIDKDENFVYTQIEKKQTTKKNNNPSQHPQFFKKTKREDCDNKKGEQELINDILFDLASEIGGVICVLNKL